MSHVKTPNETPRTHAHRVKPHGIGVAVSVFAVLLAGFFLLRADTLAEISGTVLLEGTAGEFSAVLLSEVGDSAVAVFSGDEQSALRVVNSSTGETTTQLDLPIHIQWAAVRGEKLFVREDRTDSITLVEYDAETLTETDSYSLDINPDSIIHFDCDENAACYYVLAKERAILHSATAEGEGKSFGFADRIEFFECTPNGTLWVYSGEQLYRADPQGEFAAVEFSGVPYHLLSENYLIDTDGVLYSVSTAKPEPLFRCGDALYNRLSFCLDRDGRLVVSKTGGSVSKYNTTGEAAGRLKLEKTAMAVCGCGAVYSKGKSICYAPFSFGDVEASPSPSPNVQPTDTPSVETVPAYAEGDFIIVPMGTTVAELQELFKPEAVIVRSQNGEKALNGRLSTGMTVGSWVIVVEGDCNGTGSVNIADLKIAMTLYIYSEHPEATYEISDACRRATDLNQNGMIDTEDLVMLAHLVEQAKQK